MGALTSAGVGALQTGATAYAKVTEARIEGDFARQEAEFGSAWARLQAKDARRRGEKQAELVKKQTRKLVGAQRAALAAQGIDVEKGSALDIQLESAEIGALDVLTVSNNAWREAFGYETEATSIALRGQRAFDASREKARMSIATAGATFARDTLSAVSKAAGASTKRQRGGFKTRRGRRIDLSLPSSTPFPQRPSPLRRFRK